MIAACNNAQLGKTTLYEFEVIVGGPIEQQLVYIRQNYFFFDQVKLLFLISYFCSLEAMAESIAILLRK